MWSIACILGEMLGRVALFPGRDYLDQLRLVIELLGPPTEEEVQLIESPSAISFVRKVKPESSKTFEELLPYASTASLALLRAILCFDPAKRLTAVEALKDEYLSQYHSDEDDHTSLPHKHSDWLQRFGHRRSPTRTSFRKSSCRTSFSKKCFFFTLRRSTCSGALRAGKPTSQARLRCSRWAQRTCRSH